MSDTSSLPSKVVYDFRYMTTLFRELEACLHDLVDAFLAKTLKIAELHAYSHDLIVSPTLSSLRDVSNTIFQIVVFRHALEVWIRQNVFPDTLGPLTQYFAPWFLDDGEKRSFGEMVWDMVGVTHTDRAAADRDFSGRHEPLDVPAFSAFQSCSYYVHH